MPDFDQLAFDEVTVLPPERVRYHLLRFDAALVEAFTQGLRCDEFRAASLVTQAQLFGFRSLARSLSDVFFGRCGNLESALQGAQLAIAKARPKIARLLNAPALSSAAAQLRDRPRPRRPFAKCFLQPI